MDKASLLADAYIGELRDCGAARGRCQAAGRDDLRRCHLKHTDLVRRLLGETRCPDGMVEQEEEAPRRCSC
ncbi:hypothetical protein Zm00014a_028873 [Zea mays]|uniref:Uncharacterized protein n=1 Tax=Zea mays TaxID=4577 RepID=A0A317Y7G0_MAIZE|nr:hypothetical protein Zm00014a_028873 [Zea mays]